MSQGTTDASNDGLARELQRYRESCTKLEEENARLREENRELREELASLKTTVSAVVARSIDARANTERRRYKKSGRREGHQGAGRARPERVDATVELDQSTCPRCGGVISEKPTDSYTRVVEDIVPARVVVTRYVIKRRYCCRCRRQVSPPIPNVINGGSNERFGLRLMLLIVSLKLLGTSYEKIGSLLKLLFGLDITEAAMVHCVMSVASAFGPRYEELKEELVSEASLHGDETGWRIKGKNHWLWAFVGKWSVVYEVAKSRGKDVPQEGPRRLWRDDGQRLMGRVEPRGWEASALPGPLHEGGQGHPEVQEPRRGVLPVRQEAEEDAQGLDKGRGEGHRPRGEAEGEGEARGEGRRSHRVVLLVEREELQEVRQAFEEGEGDALHVPGGGRHRLEQQRRGEGAEVERRHQEDHVREPVGRRRKGSRRPDERQGDMRPEKRELLRLRYGIPESSSKTVNVYQIC
ncbi:MAG: transposase [Nitrososphaerota archaeon]|nr:transposase [Nitrososphaerota archaeon]